MRPTVLDIITTIPSPEPRPGIVQSAVVNFRAPEFERLPDRVLACHFDGENWLEGGHHSYRPAIIDATEIERIIAAAKRIEGAIARITNAELWGKGDETVFGTVFAFWTADSDRWQYRHTVAGGPLDGFGTLAEAHADAVRCAKKDPLYERQAIGISAALGNP